jgi:predicted RNA polymerase sigma factor
VPGDNEVAGLLALMLLTDARRPARTAPDGSLVPLSEQDRMLWDADAIAEGVGLVTSALSTGPLGPYQLQAAIAAVHDEAPTAEATDWAQILGLYTLLERMAPNSMATLNRAVALAMVQGPAAGLAVLDTLSTDERIAASHHLVSVRAHLLEMAGDHDAARQLPRGRPPDHLRAREAPPPHLRRAAGLIGRRDARVEPTIPRQHPRSACLRLGAGAVGDP